MRLHKPDWREMLRRAKNDRWLYEEIQLTHNAFATLEIEAERLPENDPELLRMLETAKAQAPAPSPAETKPASKRGPKRKGTKTNG